MKRAVASRDDAGHGRNREGIQLQRSGLLLLWLKSVRRQMKLWAKNNTFELEMQLAAVAQFTLGLYSVTFAAEFEQLVRRTPLYGERISHLRTIFFVVDRPAVTAISFRM